MKYLLESNHVIFNGIQQCDTITEDHQPLLWESNLGMVMARNPKTNEISNFNYDYETAKTFAQLSECQDVKLVRTSTTIENGPVAGSLAVYGIYPVNEATVGMVRRAGQWLGSKIGTSGSKAEFTGKRELTYQINKLDAAIRQWMGQSGISNPSALELSKYFFKDPKFDVFLKKYAQSAHLDVKAPMTPVNRDALITNWAQIQYQVPAEKPQPTQTQQTNKPNGVSFTFSKMPIEGDKMTFHNGKWVQIVPESKEQVTELFDNPITQYTEKIYQADNYSVFALYEFTTKTGEIYQVKFGGQYTPTKDPNLPKKILVVQSGFAPIKNGTPQAFTTPGSNKADANQVYSTLIYIYKEFFKRAKPDAFLFITMEAKLAPLYARILKKLSAEHHMAVDTEFDPQSDMNIQILATNDKVLKFVQNQISQMF